MVAGQNKKAVIVNATDPESVSELTADKDVVIIDVRSKSEYNDGHIPHAKNIEYTQIRDKVKYDLNTKIAVYCQTGARSHVAAVQLNEMGYKYVYDMGGIDNYRGKLVK